MKKVDAAMLYASLRKDLLKSASIHRRANRHPLIVGDHHQSHLVTCQRQLGALRQAYRRTQEAIAWERYKRSVEGKSHG
jgi:hypothetical protein